MNKALETKTDKEVSRPLAQGRLSDLNKIFKLAVNGLGKGKHQLAIDYCRTIINNARIIDHREIIIEAYYIWCMSCLQLGKPFEARKACYEARLKLGNYLDLVYFEILIAAVNNEIDKILKFVDSYLELYDHPEDGFAPSGSHSREKIGDVLIMGGRAQEQAGNISGALDYYNRYIAIFPDHEPVHQLVEKLSAGQNVAEVRD